VPPTVTAVVVAFGAEPWLERAVDAVLASSGVDVDVVVVDNGCTDGAVDRLAARVTVVRPGGNLGFAAGCNAGAAVATGEWLALVNPDLLVEASCLERLVTGAIDHHATITTASFRLADRPHLLNSAGNAVHWTGMSWSGSFGEPASAHDQARPACAASGACLAMARADWDRLGGFDADFFAYYEDADLSLRVWQAGGRVVYIPDAVADHRYEFGRRPDKYFLLERNRLLMVLSCWAPRTVLVALPVHVALEGGLLLLAARQGWWRQKLDAYRWLITHRREVRARRRAVQAQRTVGERDLTPLFCAALTPANLELPRWWPHADRLLRAYWAVARRLL
jgi:GT2 family glycosyltransferase